ncbi:MAG: nucleoside triphosphate pyrophosphohydrolase, partial [Clostridium celatum]|nr:nucleoside triphosphate pyrophosphohydrolase [Clostridium celatum]
IEGEESIRKIPIYELDMQEDIDYLTSVCIPKDTNNKKDFYDLVNTIEVLRSEEGCSWDREQTHESIKNCLLEEAYEVIEAIENDDIDGLIEELGDVLLQVVFHSVIGKEDGYFNISDVIEAITSKMIYRHPHVFGNTVANTSEEVLKNWDELKKQEKNYETITEEIEGIAKTLPALIKAHKVQKKVAKVGFDFKDVIEAATKVEEEKNEILDVYKTNNREKIMNEVGDLLFACVNVSRLLEVDEEEALNKSINKFIKRFAFVEKELSKAGKDIKSSTIDEMNLLWEESKKYD